MAPASTAIARLRLFWSSGTGNSRRAARWVAESAGAQGIPSRLDEMGPGRRPRWEAGDALGLCFPTHGFTAPWSVVRFACGLPRGQGMPAFVVATRGGGWYLFTRLPGMAGTAAWLVGLALCLKGYALRGLTGLDMPSNWFSLHPGMNDRHANGWLVRAQAKSRRFAARVLEGGRWIWTPWNLVELVLGLALLPVSAAYLLIGRFFLAKLLFAGDRCNGCRLCIEHCPQRAITTRAGRPYWTFRCESCMRCAAFCPREAVEASHGLLALSLGARMLLPAAMPAGLLSGWPRTLAGAVLPPAAGLLWAGAAYHLLALGLRFRPVRFLASRATLTRWYRRYREPGTTLTDLGRPAHD